MAAMKTMMVHVLDAGVSMSDMISSDKQSTSKFELAKSIVGTILLQRMLATKTIEFGLVTYGENESQGYAEEVIPLRRPCLDTLTEIHGVNCGCEGSDVYEGLDAAHKLVTETNKGKKFNRLVVLYTDAHSCLADDSDSRELLMAMKSDDCILYILLFIDPAEMDNLSDNLDHYRDIVSSVSGYLHVVRDLASAMKFLSGGPGLSTRPMQSKIAFELAPDFKIPCVYCTKTSTASLPSLKKQSTLSYDEDVPDSGKVSMVTVYRNPSDPDEELEFEDRVKGYKYGPQYIPFGGMDDDILKLKSPPVLRLLGFIPASDIPRHHFLDVCHVLGTAHGTSDGAAARKVLLSLGYAMRSANQVALARLVKRENSDPWLVALLPPPADTEGESTNGILYMHRLPCAEDLRNFLFPPLPVDGMETEALHSVASAIDSMTVPNLGSTDSLLMYNPSHLAVLSAIQQKIGARKDPLPGVMGFDDTFRSMGDMPECRAAWAKVRKHFDLVPRDVDAEKGKKRKIYWADIDIASGGGSGAGGTDSAVGVDGVKVEAEAKETEQQMEIHIPVAIHDGSVTPPEDMDALLTVYRSITTHTASGSSSNGSTPNEAALQKVEGVIMESLSALRRIVDLLVTSGGTNAHFRKARACVKATREASIAVGDHILFNSYMQDTIKRVYRTGKYSKFWDMISEDRITLISTDDTNRPGAVTPQDAAAFLTNEQVQSVAPVVEAVADTADEEDLFEGMM